MTVPAAPLPRLRDLAASLFAAPADGVLYERANVAIAAAAESVTPAAFTAPDFLCDDALDGIRAHGIPIRFYRVTRDLGTDMASLEALDWSGPHLLMLVHYFGMTNRSRAAMESFARSRGITLLEDAAHVLHPQTRERNVVSSPRKLFAVPRGGRLFSHHTARVESSSSTPFGWIARRLVQRAMRSAGWSWHRNWTVDAFDCPPVPPRPERVAYASLDTFSRKMLRVAERDLERITAVRTRNWQRLADGIADLAHTRPMFAEPALYAFPLDVSKDIRALHAKLLEAGVPASRWPNLPPEVAASPDRHRGAFEVRERLLLLPIHQSVTDRDVDRMVGLIRQHG